MINVHSHYKLKCPEDKLFVVTCGRPGFFSPTSGKPVFADLQLLEDGKPTSTVNVGNKHKSLALRLKLSDQSPPYDIRVKNCFCYSSIASFFQLTDENGCAIHPSLGPPGITFCTYRSQKKPEGSTSLVRQTSARMDVPGESATTMIQRMANRTVELSLLAMMVLFM